MQTWEAFTAVAVALMACALLPETNAVAYDIEIPQTTEHDLLGLT